jgi:transcriptional antiterminator NusG
MNDDCNRWYALFVKTGEEDQVKEHLLCKFDDGSLRIVVPKRKLLERKNGLWGHRIRTLFPGYILLNGRLGTKEYYLIKGTPGLIRALKDDEGPIDINQSEISIINRLTSSDEVIGSSELSIKDGKISVLSGPLLGLEELIESYNKRKGRVKVRLNFNGEPKVVELSVTRKEIL